MLKVTGIVSLATVTFASLVMLSSACTAGVVVPDEGGVSQTGNGNGNGNGSGNGSGGGGGSSTSPCAVESGTYKIHFTTSSGMNCQAPPDSTTTVTGKDAGSFGSEGCTTTTDPNTCTTTSHCSTASGGGGTTTTDSTLTVSGSSGSGSLHEVVTDSSGKSILDCTFSVTYTKQ